MNYDGKIILLTGISRHSGIEFAEVLARAGARIILLKDGEPLPAQVSAATLRIGDDATATRHHWQDWSPQQVTAPLEDKKLAIDLLINHITAGSRDLSVNPVQERAYLQWVMDTTYALLSSKQQTKINVINVWSESFLQTVDQPASSVHPIATLFADSVALELTTKNRHCLNVLFEDNPMTTNQRLTITQIKDVLSVYAAGLSSLKIEAS